MSLTASMFVKSQPARWANNSLMDQMPRNTASRCSVESEAACCSSSARVSCRPASSISLCFSTSVPMLSPSLLQPIQQFVRRPAIDDVFLGQPGAAGGGHAIKQHVEIGLGVDRKSTRLNSSYQLISYAVFCLKKKKKPKTSTGLRCVQTCITRGTARSWIG